MHREKEGKNTPLQYLYSVFLWVHGWFKLLVRKHIFLHEIPSGEMSGTNLNFLNGQKILPDQIQEMMIYSHTSSF